MTDPWWDDHPPVLPPDPELEPLHAREYSVRAWKISDDSMLLRGAVMDLKPGAPFAARIEAMGGTDPGGSMGVHHMVVDLVVSYPDLTITDASVVFETFPQPGCPAISAHYRELVGLSIARGFTHEVRQRFGGPRGCTHTTALLQAMGPVAVQCIFSMRHAGAGPVDAPAQGGGQASWMRDTCHVWAGEGDLWQGVTMGLAPPKPLPMQRRLRAAGLDPNEVDLRA
ncbi:MAG TPA: DUF2889 domain-containing protein [Acidimicrobiales bacterium]|nr:DUF2889 domain-containing protein [Acidimicrobiales bacterium]